MSTLSPSRTSAVSPTAVDAADSGAAVIHLDPPRPARLSALRVGERGIVSGLDHDRAVACRLMEMGLLPGTPVEVVRVAPLGDPVEIRLRGYSLSLRRADTARVRLDVATRGSAPEPTR